MFEVDDEKKKGRIGVRKKLLNTFSQIILYLIHIMDTSELSRKKRYRLIQQCTNIPLLHMYREKGLYPFKGLDRKTLDPTG